MDRDGVARDDRVSHVTTPTRSFMHGPIPQAHPSNNKNTTSEVMSVGRRRIKGTKGEITLAPRMTCGLMAS